MKPRSLIRRNDLTPVQELEWRARRIEAVARAMFDVEHPDHSWDAEVLLLDTPRKSYSLAPRFRQLADVAIATVRDFGEYA